MVSWLSKNDGKFIMSVCCFINFLLTSQPGEGYLETLAQPRK